MAVGITGYYANQTRSIKLIHDMGETKSYLWQSVIASPVISQTTIPSDYCHLSLTPQTG